MKVKQGQRFRVLPPKGSSRTIIGQGVKPDRYISNVGGVVVEDIYGDVINASENVTYPRGTDIDYRHIRWIENHPERFQIIKSTKKED